MKKKVTKKPADEYTVYLTYMQYFATGEGMTEEVNFCVANNKEEAREKHLDRFYGNNTDARNYFGRGIEVMEFSSKKSKALVKQIFKNGEHLWMHLNEAGLEMHFKIHYNHS